MTTFFANSPVVTALNIELFLPRSVRGPVGCFAFLRFAASFFSVTVTMRLKAIFSMFAAIFN